MRTYKKPTSEELRQKLTPLQYEVTQNEATEPPHENEYWDNQAEGYTLTSLPANRFSAQKKSSTSSCGLASFDKSLVPENFTERADHKFGKHRTEEAF